MSRARLGGVPHFLARGSPSSSTNPRPPEPTQRQIPRRFLPTFDSALRQSPSSRTSDLHVEVSAHLDGLGSPWYVMPRTFHYTSLPAYPCSLPHPHVRFVPGILVILFLKCVAALVNPVHRRGEPIKWGLVSYAPVMFLIATTENAVDIHTRSISHTDSCEFSGIEGEVSGGPIGYQIFISHEAIAVLTDVMLFLNAWLANGLLVGLFPLAFTCSKRT